MCRFVSGTFFHATIKMYTVVSQKRTLLSRAYEAEEREDREEEAKGKKVKKCVILWLRTLKKKTGPSWSHHRRGAKKKSTYPSPRVSRLGAVLVLNRLRNNPSNRS